MSPEIIHSIILILTIAFSFFLTRSPIYEYELQITALIFIIYFIVKKKLKVKEGNPRLLDSIIFTLIISNIVNSTGGYSSPLFFLNYFLIFALSMLIEPVISISVVCALLIFYLFTLPPDQPLSSLLSLFSLPFLTPFALFLGKEYQKDLEQKKVIKILSQSLAEEKGKEAELKKVLEELQAEMN